MSLAAARTSGGIAACVRAPSSLCGSALCPRSAGVSSTGPTEREREREREKNTQTQTERARRHNQRERMRERERARTPASAMARCCVHTTRTPCVRCLAGSRSSWRGPAGAHSAEENKDSHLLPYLFQHCQRECVRARAASPHAHPLHALSSFPLLPP
eukprot:3479038-Rhodomonas_salina.1